MEEVWRTYFASIFNPARLKVAMMKSEMPVKYWRNLPEAELIPSLIRGAKQAEAEMIARASTEPPSRHMRAEARKVEPEEAREITSLADARAAVQGCRRCPLYEYATQAVFGEGPQTRGGDVRRRAAGRPGGSGGQAVRRAGRAGVRPGAREGRHRPAAGLRHQRGQAFQVRAARQAAHPPEAEYAAKSRPAGSGSSSSANSCGPSWSWRWARRRCRA